MSDEYRLVELRAAAAEVESIAFSKTPETFFHTKWCAGSVRGWDKLQRIIDKASQLDSIDALRQKLEAAREATFGPEPPRWPPGPHCKTHAPLWPLIQSICAAALRADDEAATSN